jgi:hypothetical protein
MPQYISNVMTSQTKGNCNFQLMFTTLQGKCLDVTSGVMFYTNLWLEGWLKQQVWPTPHTTFQYECKDCLRHGV